MTNRADLHYCDNHSEFKPYGPAFDLCYEDEEGRLWVENGEDLKKLWETPIGN